MNVTSLPKGDTQESFVMTQIHIFIMTSAQGQHMCFNYEFTLKTTKSSQIQASLGCEMMLTFVEFK